MPQQGCEGQGTVFSLYHVGPGDQTPVVMLGGQHSHPLSHFASVHILIKKD